LEKCKVRHDDVMMMQKLKQQAKLIRGFFWAVTTDTTNKGSRPEIHFNVGGGRERWCDYRIFELHVDRLDTTNKRLLLRLMKVTKTFPVATLS